MDDLLAEFIAECTEMLEALGGEVVAWEANPADRERLDAIFRFVHTVKGNCGFFDFPRLAALSHAAEDALADVRAGRRTPDPDLVSAVLAVIDRISDFVEAIAAGSEWPGENDDALIAALRDDAEALAPDVGVDAPAILANPATRGAVRTTSLQRSVRLPVDLLDQVMSGVSDIVLARNELARRLRETGGGEAVVESAFEQLSAMIGKVRDAMTRTRMQAIETLFATLPRLVRDVSMQLGKQVLVDLDGGDVELDREMVEFIRDPLTHIIRNAIDHGIEAPAARLAQGKREIGILSISARQSGNHILIDIVDDGRGIDCAGLVERAIAAGILTPGQAEALSPRERALLVCQPGLSTASEVTSISGRGVGMDVVRANVERIGGTIEIDTVQSIGTRITLRVPLTLTITPVLSIGIGAQRFAVPRSCVEEVLDAGAGGLEFSRLGEAELVKVRDQWVPCLQLGRVLGLESAAATATRTVVLIRLADGEVFGLSADCLFNHEELVIKPVAPAVMATGLYAGATLTDEGDPILLLDVAGVARHGGLVFDMRDRSLRDFGEDFAEPEAGPPVLVFTALDGRRRAIRLAVVDRIDEVEVAALRAAAGTGFVALGEEILPLVGSIAGLPEHGTVKVLRLSDGERAIAHACRNDADIRPLAEAVTPGLDGGEVEGIVLIDDLPVEIVDPHWLFSRFARARPGGTDKVCRLPGNDPWVRDFLRPLVEAAGYRVAEDGEEVVAALAIGPDDWDCEDAGAARRIVLRMEPAPAGDGDASIYRYDRPALMAALCANG